MPENIDDLIPSATQIRKEAALKEAEKAEEYAHRTAAAEAEKRALIERLTQSSGLRLSESSIASRFKRSPKTRTDATFDFCNSICQRPTIATRSSNSPD
jgi:hypothetical protein